MTPPPIPRDLDARSFRRVLRWLHGQDHGALRAGARILLTPYRTVQAWAAETPKRRQPIPGSAVAALRLAVQLRQHLES